MSNDRVSPFGDLGDFAPSPAKTKPAPKAVIEQVAADNGFPSRQPAKPAEAPAAQSAPRQQRRYTTGRNQQINIKAKAETIDRLYRIADAQGVPLGEVLERALDALEKSRR
jgi:hypothetical protein